VQSTGEKFRDYHPYQYINRLSCASILNNQVIFNTKFESGVDPKLFLGEHISEWVGAGENIDVEKRYGVMSGFPPVETGNFAKYRTASARVAKVNAGELNIEAITDQDRKILGQRQQYKDDINDLVPFLSFSEVGREWSQYLSSLEKKYFVKH
jgi:hypothetical protein